MPGRSVERAIQLSEHGIWVLLSRSSLLDRLNWINWNLILAETELRYPLHAY